MAQLADHRTQVLPLSTDRDWQTRSAAALAIEEIGRAVGVWDPTHLEADVAVASSSKLGPPSLGFDLDALLSSRAELLASSGHEFAAAPAADDDAEPDVKPALNGKGKGNAPAASAPAPAEDLSHLSAQERNMLKRKRKAESKAAATSGRPAKCDAG